ncbi:DUF2927 domain-containing protein [Pseudoroseicyclus tamaricis]|uniref:DUF2927 domain-containing protein n=1 Tax=Pseudoroseicyclus tamaricis TaxID=2705421 RepID=A0A6B2JND8_9RHOB|nr:DUF2927 domain-containing protein [Pseudoroseicyclus tamaricis]NDU99547.1 DUF2927 domain-containing protein [Pseudoroseicyclus tamaricis]
MRAGWARRYVALAGLAALLGCSEPQSTAVTAPRPVPAPAAVVVPPPAPVPAGPSAASADLAAYYRREEARLLSQGLLRTDGGGVDTPFTDTMLARNFISIALYDEYVETTGGAYEARPTASVLNRWEQPITFNVEAGPSVPAAQAASDRANVAAYASRLSRLTGLPMSVSPVQGQGNFHVLLLGEDDRAGYAPRIRTLLPGISESSLRAILTPPRDTYCLVISFADRSGNAFGSALALIRAEHPDLLRLACLHEELAQGLGLPNDSASARPSIFNDDQEFALLTRQDELLLRILYDRRLRPGMSAAEATPLVTQIARELTVSGPI